MKVLVVGATGFMGRESVRQLLQAGMQVRAMTRTPEKAADLKQLGAEVVQGDLIDPASLEKACQDMEAVVSAAHSLLGGGKYSSRAVDLAGHLSLVDAAKAAGVQHIVYASLLGLTPDSPLEFARYKNAVEQYIQSSGMHYTILRLPAFMEWHAHIFLGKGILEKGQTSILGAGEDKVNFISACDVAKFVVIGLTNARACDRVLDVGGPSNITKNDLAKMYMEFSGKQAKVSHLPKPMMRVMSVALKPFQPGVSRVMLLSYLNEGHDQSFDPTKLLQEFPVQMMIIEEFVKARVAEWKKN